MSSRQRVESMYRRRSFVRYIYIYTSTRIYHHHHLTPPPESPTPSSSSSTNEWRARASRRRRRHRTRPITRTTDPLPSGCIDPKPIFNQRHRPCITPMHHAHATRTPIAIDEYSDIRKLHTSIHIPHVKYDDVNEEGDLCWRYLSSSYMNSKKSHSSHFAKRN